MFLILQPKLLKNIFSSKETLHGLSIETFEISKGGYGYDIILNERVIIKQEIIPSISSNVPFRTEKDAEKTAKLVVEKLKCKQLPFVTQKELDSLQIEY